MAHHGYVVIQPQFRISTGFGRKHLEAGYSRWGYEMQDDLDDAITYLAKRNLQIQPGQPFSAGVMVAMPPLSDRSGTPIPTVAPFPEPG